MRIGIVGGGVTGLVAGYRLSQAGHTVTIYEKNKQAGGQAGTFEVAGTRLEHFYHHIYPSDTDVVRLIEEMGLREKLVWLSSRMGYFYDGTAYDFVTPKDLLNFTPLTLMQRLKLGMQTLYLQRFGNWRHLERITAKEWVLQWGGQRIYDVMWGALLRSKFGPDAERVNMAWLWGKIALRRKLAGGGLKQETLGYMLGSFQLLTDALIAGITEAGGRVLTGAQVERVRIERGEARGLTYTYEKLSQVAEHDAIIMTVPSPVAMHLAPEIPDPYALRLRELKYMAAQVLVLELSESLSPYYWLNLADPSIPLVAAIEHTNYVPRAHYGGTHLLYLSNYLSVDDMQFLMDADSLIRLYTPSLQKINPRFSPEWIKQRWLFSDQYAQPVIGLDYSGRIPGLRTPIKKLYLANTSQIYPEDRGMNYAVRLGEAISETVQGRPAAVSERW